MKHTIEFVDEQLDAIVLDELKQQYECAVTSTMTMVLKEDKKYNKKIVKALRLVLEHNMTADEVGEYFND